MTPDQKDNLVSALSALVEGQAALHILYCPSDAEGEALLIARADPFQRKELMAIRMEAQDGRLIRGTAERAGARLVFRCEESTDEELLAHLRGPLAEILPALAEALVIAPDAPLPEAPASLPEVQTPATERSEPPVPAPAPLAERVSAPAPISAPLAERVSAPAPISAPLAERVSAPAPISAPPAERVSAPAPISAPPAERVSAPAPISAPPAERVAPPATPEMQAQAQLDALLDSLVGKSGAQYTARLRPALDALATAALPAEAPASAVDPGPAMQRLVARVKAARDGAGRLKLVARTRPAREFFADPAPEGEVEALLAARGRPGADLQVATGHLVDMVVAMVDANKQVHHFLGWRSQLSPDQLNTVEQSAAQLDALIRAHVGLAARLARRA